ncbi:hypothetical protein PanWU01x14_349720 [Parasponia andersonii]|uniref:Uncharacterized protein n=1 Tax=Parasponia andersonii TaxID=3476 RepID=A0A2P5AB72_PARAD|nr:hypothetical protein PanWU01x14_349720 [Parasponia andersonii]
MDNVVDAVFSTPEGKIYLVPEVTTCPPAPIKQALKKQRSSVNVLAKKFKEALANEDDEVSTANQKTGQST